VRDVASGEPAARRAALPRWTFVLWVLLFEFGWLLFVTRSGGWPGVRAHWPIALAMLFGSYVAGSTPMGGGSVAFPILVLLLGEPAALGRSFAFAIQALGMSSAVLYLLAAGRPLAWGVLRWALLGSLVATPIGVAWLAPRVPELGVKLVYAVVWASFGMITLLRLSELAGQLGIRDLGPGTQRSAGLLAGAIGGGAIASVAGVGADMLLYSVLVLLFRADPRLAIPTAVSLMAFTSVVGVATGALLSTFDPSAPLLHPGVAGHWLAAAPVVVLGAPLGALAVSVIPRTGTLALVALLCLAQLAWICAQARLSPAGIACVVAAVLGLGGMLLLLRTQDRRAGRATPRLL
jgi:uncharacterized membrane protein YfcA